LSVQSGIVILAKLEQPAKVSRLIEVTPLGITKFVKLVHISKAPVPIEETLLGFFYIRTTSNKQMLKRKKCASKKRILSSFKCNGCD